MTEAAYEADSSVDDLIGVTTPDLNEPDTSVTVGIDDVPTPEAEPVAEPSEPATPEIDPIDLLMARIVDVTDADKFLRILIYGAPGTRKTTWCAGAPNPLLYELDTGGTKSLMRDPALTNVQKLPFRSIEQANLLIQALVNDDERFAKYETFVIDTYNGLQAKDLDRIPAMSDGKPNYNVNTQNLKRYTDMLKHINKHVIITVHVQEVKDDSTGRIHLRPALTPKVAEAVFGDFDIIGYMELEENVWTLRLEKTPTITAKTRVDGLPPVIENPNFTQILSAYEAMRANAKANKVTN